MTAALSVGGCESVVFSGRTGISVDTDGHLVAVVALCEGFVDGLTVYTDHGEGEPTIADLGTTTPIRDFGRVILAEPAPPWVAHHELEPLQPGVEYVAYGWSHTQEWASAHVSFTTRQLSQLRPGQVLYQRYDEKADDDRDVVLPEAQFRTDTCSEQ